jgi:hypothetical protein
MPTFICNFSDGEQTRMTVHCRKGLDVARAASNSFATLTRVERERRPPAMTGATFVPSDGHTMLISYRADELAKAA